MAWLHDKSREHSQIVRYVIVFEAYRMHVLILPSGNYQTLREPLGGIFQYHQGQALCRRGILVGVISAGLIPLKFSFSRYPYSNYENDNGIHTFRLFRRQLLPERVALRLGVDSNCRLMEKMYLERFAEYIRQVGVPDVIHAHDCIYSGLAAKAIKENWGVPYLLTEHTSAHMETRVPGWLIPRIRDVLEAADVRSCVSTRACESMARLYRTNTARPFVNIGNLLEKRFELAFEAKVSAAESPNSAFTFLNVASLDNNKAHAVLLSAFSRCFRDRKEVRLRIVGNGPMRAALPQKAKQLGIEDQVTLLGYLDRGSVLQEFTNCDAFVLSSHIETFGVVLIEALACGKPVISTACGGPEDIVNDLNGILVPPNNPQALGEGMNRLMLNSRNYDATAIRRDCVARFGEAAFVDKIIALYEKVIAPRPPSANAF